MAEMDVMRRVTEWVYDSKEEREWMTREIERMKGHGINAEIMKSPSDKRWIGLFRDSMTGVEKENTIVWTSHRRNT